MIERNMFGGGLEYDGNDDERYWVFTSECDAVGTTHRTPCIINFGFKIYLDSLVLHTV